MISASRAAILAQDYAREFLASREEGYSLVEVPTKNVSPTDWSFAYALVAPEGATGSPSIVLVDKQTGHARTLRDAIAEGWKGGQDK